jgi:hypothetical protein
MEGSDFSLGAVARMLRRWEIRPPDRVTQAKDEICARWGNWCLRLVWQKGAHRRRGVLESDPEVSENINNCLDFVEMILECFQGVAVLSHLNNKWFWRREEEGAILIPAHLAGWMVRPESAEEDTHVEGTVHCPCGCEHLEYHYPGATHIPEGGAGTPIPCSVKVPDGRGGKRYWFGLKAVCTACRKRCVVFDSDLHGWNGFQRSHASSARQMKSPHPRLLPWRCLKCGGKAHEGAIHFRFEAPGDFLRKTEGRFRIERRVDMFGWFGMEIKCGGCGHETTSWVGFETA